MPTMILLSVRESKDRGQAILRHNQLREGGGSPGHALT